MHSALLAAGELSGGTATCSGPDMLTTYAAGTLHSVLPDSSQSKDAGLVMNYLRNAQSNKARAGRQRRHQACGGKVPLAALDGPVLDPAARTAANIDICSAAEQDALGEEHSTRKPGSHAARSPQDRWPHRHTSQLSETSIRLPQTTAAADTMQAALTSSAVRPAGLAQAVRPSAQRPRVSRAVVCRCAFKGCLWTSGIARERLRPIIGACSCSSLSCRW